MQRNVAFLRKLIFCLPLLLNASKVHAGILDVNVIGGTFHPHNVERRKIPMIPRGLDKRAKWVVTPGVSVGYDFRAPDKKRGVSAYVRASYNRDCFDWSFFLLGYGMRYRYDFSKRYTFRFNLLGAIVFTNQKELCTEIWPPLNPFQNRLPFTKHKRFIFTPATTIELQYQLSNTEALGLECGLSVYAFVLSVTFSHVLPKRKGVVQVSK